MSSRLKLAGGLTEPLLGLPHECGGSDPWPEDVEVDFDVNFTFWRAGVNKLGGKQAGLLVLHATTQDAVMAGVGGNIVAWVFAALVAGMVQGWRGGVRQRQVTVFRRSFHALARLARSHPLDEVP